MEIDYDAPDTPYRQIAAWIRAQIESGDLAPDRRIPSESTIQQSTGAARTTICRAVRLLREEGYVYTIAGRGSFVARR